MTDPKDFGLNSFLMWPKGLSERIRDAETKENLQMRQYRGLTKEGKWVYGWLIESQDRAFIIPPEWLLDATRTQLPLPEQEALLDWIEVIPETVGQSTGLKDKNGKEIYEGDIIRDATLSGYTKWWDGIVTWHDAGSVGWVSEPLPENKHRGAWGLNYNYDYEILGNIHQPEEQKHG